MKFRHVTNLPKNVVYKQMGANFFDQYSLLHFAVGIVIEFWNVSLPIWHVFHLLFETIENTTFGVNFIDTYLTLWPGGKLRSDSLLNSLGDQFFGIAGWLFSRWFRKQFVSRS